MPRVAEPPKSESALLERCEQIAGMSFYQLAISVGLDIPQSALQRKGWTGKAIELALGASAGNAAEPDFNHLGIELKTIPVNQLGKPAESTFITTIPLLTVHKQHWSSSVCFNKLKRILWVPVEGDKNIPFEHRRLGSAILWSPDQNQTTILTNDWHELTLMIGTGRLAEIDASKGTYLQVRPKAANAKALCYGLDEEGNKVLTLPRGFYLRTQLTRQIIGG